ncbi:hypothetical protein M758_5G124100 [Ceratodon purpureus]|nr:hypothetical protein M758_5G124100 [Ceratodon purpureus]
MILPCNIQQLSPMEWKFRIKTALLLFASLGTGIFLGAVGCLHYDINAIIQNRALFSTNTADGCPPAKVILTKEEAEKVAMASEPAKIAPPKASTLQHGLPDEELLWRASLTHRRTVVLAQHRKVPKVAFMFLTRGPLPLAPLWEHFFANFHELFSIYVHAHPSYTPTTSPSSVFHLRNIPSQPANWGEISMCDAERRLLANALLDPANERFILLSESCIPLYNFSYIYAAFTNIPYSYVQAFDDPSIYGRGRYTPHMMPEVTLQQWRKGSQWFEVTREHAVEIVADSKYYRKFKTYCRPHCYVDEHYIQTMLSIDHGAMLMNRTITHTEWVFGQAHPSTFTKNDISREFLSRIRGFYFFSRKYAPSALEPLLKLAPQVMFIPTGHF